MPLTGSCDLAIVHGALEERGGAERKLLLLAQAARAVPGVRVTVYVLSFDPTRTFVEYLDGLDVRVVRGGGSLARAIALLRIAWRLRRASLVHAHNHPAQLAAGAARRLFGGPPVLWFCNETALHLDANVRRERPWKLALARALERRALLGVDLVVANSEHTRGTIRAALGRDSEVVYSGVDTDRLTPRVKDIEQRGAQVLTVSRFTREKRLDLVLELAARSPGCRFTLAGNGPELETLRHAIHERGLSNLELRVSPSEDEKIHLYRSSDVFVFPTPDEPLGVSVIEAMACGLPVVAHDSGGARETVLHGETGFRVTTEEAFASALQELLDDRALRGRMAAAGRSRAVERFSLDRMTQETFARYNRLLAQSGNSFRFPDGPGPSRIR